VDEKGFEPSASSLRTMYEIKKDVVLQPLTSIRPVSIGQLGQLRSRVFCRVQLKRVFWTHFDVTEGREASTFNSFPSFL
jgi:hypothetical protein